MSHIPRSNESEIESLAKMLYDKKLASSHADAREKASAIIGVTLWESKKRTMMSKPTSQDPYDQDMQTPGVVEERIGGEKIFGSLIGEITEQEFNPEYTQTDSTHPDHPEYDITKEERSLKEVIGVEEEIVSDEYKDLKEMAESIVIEPAISYQDDVSTVADKASEDEPFSELASYAEDIKIANEMTSDVMQKPEEAVDDIRECTITETETIAETDEETTSDIEEKTFLETEEEEKPKTLD